MKDIAYFISWTCYGQWLHGDSRGSVDVEHNEFGRAWLPTDHQRLHEEREQMSQEPYILDPQRRRIVLKAIRDVCTYRKWTLHAIHVRPQHVHVVVSGDAAPERMMNDFKSYASRALNAANLDGPERKRWTRHGSTRHIDDERYLAAAVHYVLYKQGEPMERWPEDSALLEMIKENARPCEKEAGELRP
ncbi:MAG TPA: transposase [Gemmataceae bacterium]|nr:transposase [Gemmataceae bacterium]